MLANVNNVTSAGAAAVGENHNYTKTTETMANNLDDKITLLEKKVELNYNSVNDKIDTLTRDHNELLAQVKILSNNFSTFSNTTTEILKHTV